MKQISFVSWGRSQLIAANEAKFREAVEAKYASEFAQAGFFRRLLLRRRVESEVRQELDKIAPRNALYSSS